MKLELFIFGITAFLVFNTYYDGKYLKVFHSWQKEIKMSTFAFVGLSLYIYLKKNPGQSQTMMSHANDIIRYMPISRSSADMLSPFLDFANQKSLFQEGGAGNVDVNVNVAAKSVFVDTGFVKINGAVPNARGATLKFVSIGVMVAIYTY